MTINHDFRAKLQAKPLAKQEVYGGGSKDYRKNLLAPIAYTNGLVFPYTPAIQVSHAQVDYSQYNLLQTNFDYYAFVRRASPTFSVTSSCIRAWAMVGSLNNSLKTSGNSDST